MDALPERLLYYGEERPLPKRHILRAGPLTAVYEDGDLRYIRLGTEEILRRVYVAVRDRNWDTIPAELSNLQMEISDTAFEITYDAEHKRDDIHFLWKGTITGEPDGTIRFEMDGEARSTFLRNRIGFCVLHPMAECAGEPCMVQHVDGTTTESHFPRDISPHQPFKNMRAITHEVAPGVEAEVVFEGDTFEMEDQRNWTDASYKTYCTPLELPFPVEVRAGTEIAQRVTLKLRGDVPPGAKDAETDRLTLTVGNTAGLAVAPIGLGVASHGEPLSAEEIDRLRALNLSHLRVDLHLQDHDYEDTLRRATAEAEALNIGLEAVIHVTDDAAEELRDLLQLLHSIRPPVVHWLVFHDEEKSTAAEWVRLAREHLSAYDPSAMIGAGTDAYFTELNRERPPVRQLDLVAYSLNPQVHAFDNLSLVETLEAQATTVESAHKFIDGLPLAVTPVTLKPRFNPNATAPEPVPGPDGLSSQVDKRQMSLFGAGWTTGSLKYLLASDIHSVTYYETTGWRGVMETEAGSKLPEHFQSLPGAVFPLYHVLADVGEFADGEVVPTTSSDKLLFDGLALRKNGRLRVIIANFGAEPRAVTLANLNGAVRVRHLDETNAIQAMRLPQAYRREAGRRQATEGGALTLQLRPFGLATIDYEEEVHAHDATGES